MMITLVRSDDLADLVLGFIVVVFLGIDITYNWNFLLKLIFKWGVVLETRSNLENPKQALS